MILARYFQYEKNVVSPAKNANNKIIESSKNTEKIVICFIGGGGEVQKRDYSEARREYRSFTTKPAQPKLPCFFQECQRSARHAEVRAGGGGAHRGVPGRPLTLEKETWQLSVLRGLKLRYSICRTESRF